MSSNPREQITETVVDSAPTSTVEERIVDPDGTVHRIVRTVGEAAPAIPPTAFPATTRRTVSRFWQRTRVPAGTVATEYEATGAFARQPTLGEFLRAVWFFIGLLEGLLALRFSLALLGANPNNSFAALVYGTTGPLVAPFKTLFGVPAAGGAVLETYTLMAMLVVLFGWWLMVRLIGVLTNRYLDV